MIQLYVIFDKIVDQTIELQEKTNHLIAFVQQLSRRFKEKWTYTILIKPQTFTQYKIELGTLIGGMTVDNTQFPIQNVLDRIIMIKIIISIIYNTIEAVKSKFKEINDRENEIYVNLQSIFTLIMAILRGLFNILSTWHN